MNFDISSNLFSNIWAIFLVILFFGGSIFIHELGHLLAAKRRGLKIERFSIGFGPRLFTWKKDGIEYCISLLPLGGYVALPQITDMNANEGKDGKNRLSEISYTSKVIVASMGAIFNLVFAFILALILWGVGQPSSYEQQTNIVGYVAKDIRLDLDTEAVGPAFAAGIRPGDKIIAVDGTDVGDFQEIRQLLVTGSGRTDKGKPLAEFSILRGSETLTIAVEPELVQFNVASNDRIRTAGFNPAQILNVSGVMKGSPAETAGIQSGDTILAADDISLYSLSTLSEMLKENPQKAVDITIMRKNEKLTLPLKAELVPFTKPLVKLEATGTDNQKVAIQFVPIYGKDQKFTNLAAPTNNAALAIFETNAKGTMPNDTILGINDVQPKSIQELITTTGKLNSQPLNFAILSNGSEYNLKLTPPYSTEVIPSQEQAIIGIQVGVTTTIEHINPIKQFSDNIAITFRTLGSLMSKGSNVSLQNLMGPPGIIRTLYAFSSQDFRLLIWLLILLNINLAVLNLLPIPVLDGGHIAFFTIHKLRGRPLHPHFVASLQTAFMIMLFGLMIYISFFDIRRWQGESELEKKIKAQQALYIPYKFTNG